MSDIQRAGFLTRTDDVTGLSGTGMVAWLVEFPDGPCVVRWCVSSNVYDGRTEPEWVQ